MKFNHTNTMKNDNKPEAPEGYTVMLGKDVPHPLFAGTKAWHEGKWHEAGSKLFRWMLDLWYAVPNGLTPSQSIAEEAAAVVAGDRAADYGDVNESFARIAKLWSAYTGSTISPWDVAQMMILLKVSRAKTSTKRDTLVDIIGYAECANHLKHGTPVDNRPPKGQNVL